MSGSMLAPTGLLAYRGKVCHLRRPAHERRAAAGTKTKYIRLPTPIRALDECTFSYPRDINRTIL